MIRRDRQIVICRILIGLALCFIWGNSLLPAEQSQALSDSVQDLLISFRAVVAAAMEGGNLLRKLAHFLEFTALGLLLCWLTELQCRQPRRALMMGAAAACIDECIQFFVPGRAPGVLDVAIDCCGVLTGMFLLQFGYLFYQKTQSKQNGGF